MDWAAAVAAAIAAVTMATVPSTASSAIAGRLHTCLHDTESNHLTRCRCGHVELARNTKHCGLCTRLRRAFVGGWVEIGRHTDAQTIPSLPIVDGWMELLTCGALIADPCRTDALIVVRCEVCARSVIDWSETALRALVGSISAVSPPKVASQHAERPVRVFRSSSRHVSFEPSACPLELLPRIGAMQQATQLVDRIMMSSASVTTERTVHAERSLAYLGL